MSELIHRCRKCSDELNEDNWYRHHKLQYNNICKKCARFSEAEMRRNKNPHMRKYSPRPDPSSLRICNKCGAGLIIGENWTEHNKEKHIYTCKHCVKNYNKQWHRDNHEKAKASNKKWQEANPERYLDSKRRWAQNNREKKNISNELWRKNHHEKSVLSSRHWQITHRNNWLEIKLRNQNKRERGLPTTIILGKRFPNSHLHHMTPYIAVYIPIALHRSIPHNIWTGYNMDKINALAMEFYERGN